LEVAGGRVKSSEFVVFAYPWDEQVGGVIVLHTLCARLEELGYRAAIWPYWKPARAPRDWRTLRMWLGYVLKGRFLKRFDTGPFKPRFARWRDLRSAAVIYPEVVAGNPLGARKVVRWLLYKPGEHTGTVDYGSHDLIVTYNHAFAESSRFRGCERLHVSYENPVYRQWNFGEREGSCFLVRKGAGRSLDQHPADAVPIDELDHEAQAEVFNQVAYCYCYDLYTYYAVYAAVCGCIPVIVPQPGLSEEEWHPEEASRLGLAYGSEKIAWAESTREELLRHLKEKRVSDDESIRQFVATARAKKHW
jgi:hypothetical protein